MNRFLPPLAALLAAAAAARADLIFFKDGFVIEGVTVREGKAENDGGELVWIPKGFFYCDDFARRTYFSPAQIQEPAKKEFRFSPEDEFKSTLVVRYPSGMRSLPPIRDVLDVGPFSDKWERKVALLVKGGKTTVTQHLTVLNPHCFRADTLVSSPYIWGCYYLTRELGPAAARDLINTQPGQKPLKDLTDGEKAARRFKVYYFFVQAGWFDDAAKELDGIAADLPAEKDKVETARKGLRKLQAQRVFDEAQRARAAGQHKLAAKRLADVPEGGIEEKLLTESRDLRAKYEAAAADLELARRLLDELPKAVDNADERALLGEAAAAVRGEVGLDDFLPPPREADKARVGRLDLFLTLAKQYEEQKKNGQKPDPGPAPVLSLAVTGWLTGGAAAEAKVDAAKKLWLARKLVLDYLRAADRRDRQKLLDDYQKAAHALPADVVANLVGLLPPPEPEKDTAPDVTEAETSGRPRVSYLLQLPPEYDHHRPFGYPVLFVLHNKGERPREVLDRWSKLAAERGYVLVAPEWARGLSATYNYSAAEHAAVLDVLRDLRRRFQVDSDRVFLFGHGEGGNMAYDVGLSHPDLFAGVVPMSARPQFFASRFYWANAQYLGVYAIGGEHCESYKDTRELFEKWVAPGYPVVYAVYRGRGEEWYGAELPRALDWMDHKTRANPLHEVGRYKSSSQSLYSPFQVARETDNRFYWLSTDAVLPSCVHDVSSWNKHKYAATLTALIGAGNQINVNTEGLKQVSVWLQRGTLIDFDKQVNVYVNKTLFKKKAEPSLAVLLDDLYQRGDRQRLYLARLDFDLK